MHLVLVRMVSKFAPELGTLVNWVGTGSEVMFCGSTRELGALVDLSVALAWCRLVGLIKKLHVFLKKRERHRDTETQRRERSHNCYQTADWCDAAPSRTGVASDIAQQSRTVQSTRWRTAHMVTSGCTLTETHTYSHLT